MTDINNHNRSAAVEQDAAFHAAVMARVNEYMARADARRNGEAPLQEVTEQELFARFLKAKFTFGGASNLRLRAPGVDRDDVRYELLETTDAPSCIADNFSEDLIEGLKEAELPSGELDWAIDFLEGVVTNLKEVRDLFNDLMEANIVPEPGDDAPAAEHQAWKDNPRYLVRVNVAPGAAQ